MLNRSSAKSNFSLTSPGFTATDTQKSFFTFVVETVLAGRSQEIKGYTVATEVFGKREDVNQATDPIVSRPTSFGEHSNGITWWRGKTTPFASSEQR